MATVYPYIAESAQAGQVVALKLHEIFWKTVGQGEVLSLSDYEVDIAGHLSMMVYSGDLHIQLRLLDADEAATSGPCVLHFNTHVDENATYQVGKDGLSVRADFDGKKAGIRLSRDHDGRMTRCDMDGVIGLTAYLEPIHP